MDSGDEIFADPSIDIVLLFVPPWLRRDLFAKAAAAGKHVLMTKPLAGSRADCEAMQAIAVESDIRCGVIYGRTGDAWMESCKSLLDGGTKGRLALYRQDWIHAYPQWNAWATDPEKNGGPFMDAMIHNLNAASYLMGRPLIDATMFSDRLSHPDMACADTESVVAHYDGGVAHLFITWAADLAVHSTAGNDREHIDHFYLVTDQGWHLTKQSDDNGAYIRASRNGEVELIPLAVDPGNLYENFSAAISTGGPLPSTLADLESAAHDIIALRRLYAQPGKQLSFAQAATV